MSVKQVICINWGTKYGPLYIDRLYGMVARNITPPFSFTCFCDDPTGIRPEVDCQPLPEIDYEIPKAKTGIWPKSRLWGPKLGTLTGPVLFLDLDVIVTGSLDPFFEHGAPDDVILTRNRVVAFEKLGQTSVFRFPAGGLLPLQTLFKTDPKGIADEYRYEQRFVTRNAPGGVKFFPDGWVAHFRRNCRRPFPLNYLLAPKLPKDTRIVIFAGHLNPQDAIDGRWSDAVPPRSPLAHLRAIGQRDRGGSLWRYLRHYIRPTPWVGDHWRP
ncbi:glycosyl transferase [Loktanella sp. SALINAS62]|uniref:glycosyl transferase n=1 Tax=Loktanella sp. SALINAS62 TaxID=2706124 RepID=UPI001B8B6B33|nr:glycosyl transferase [Loktanella sp. SALINAS62]MBS1304235.1 glycosyl transferase [Loktanella sp. SALINAS62]